MFFRYCHAMKKYLFTALLLLALPSYALAEEQGFHAPETVAEKAMDEVLSKAGKAEDVKSRLTKSFLDAWSGRFDAESTFESLTCSTDGYNDYSTYKTLREDGDIAVISYTAYNRPFSPLYRLKNDEGHWKIDGIYCDEELNIGMTDEVSRHCQSLSEQSTSTVMCAMHDFHKEKQALSETLSTLEQGYAENPEGLAKLKKAQEAWDAFVKAQLDLMYFDHGGSVVPMCRRNDMIYFMTERNKQLRQWMESRSTEGDVCGGL